MQNSFGNPLTACSGHPERVFTASGCSKRLSRKGYGILFGLGFVLVSANGLQAQPGTPPSKPDTVIGPNRLLSGGRLWVHARSYFSKSWNRGNLADPYALALGLAMGYETAPFLRNGAFSAQMAVSGSSVEKLFSSDLSRIDSLRAPTANRYEASLFDFTRPGLGRNLNRLENLYLRLNLGQNQLTLGKMQLTTPFLNPQDSRMRPTLVEGAWLNLRSLKKVQVEGGWIWQVSPRSSVNWYSTGNSVGLYSRGVNEKGIRSNYSGHVQTAGLGILGITWKALETLTLQSWHYWLENVFYLGHARAELNLPLNSKDKLLAGLQYNYETALNHGGNPDPGKAYILPGTLSQVFSGRLGWQAPNWKSTLNYTCITGDSRFLFPREWGREPFYTFLQRERNEGTGNTQAMTFTWEGKKQRLRYGAAYGRYWLSDVHNYRLNKYGQPSYWQVNLELGYAFKGFFKGLEAKALYCYKGNLGNTYGNPRYVYQKVDMSLFNLILDLRLP